MAEKEGITVFDMENIWNTVMALLLAVAGGITRLLHGKDQKKYKLGMIFSEVFISAFAGSMVLLLARAFGLSGDWLGLVCGMAGWIGPRILDLIAKHAAKKIGIDLDEKDKKD